MAQQGFRKPRDSTTKRALTSPRKKRDSTRLSFSPEEFDIIDMSRDDITAPKKQKPSILVDKSDEAVEIGRSVFRINKKLKAFHSNIKEEVKDEMEKLEKSLMKKHGKDLKELRQEYEDLYDSGSISKIELSTDNKVLKNQVKSLESANVNLERRLKTEGVKNNSEQILKLQRELERGKTAKVDVEKRHAEERAAGVLAVHAAEDKAKKITLKKEDEADANASDIIEIRVVKRTHKLETEVQALKSTISDLEVEKAEEEKAAKNFADERVAECKMKLEAENKALKDRISRFERLDNALKELSQSRQGS